MVNDGFDLAGRLFAAGIDESPSFAFALRVFVAQNLWHRLF